MEKRSYAERKAYQQKYQRERVARRRAEFFADKSCAKCGSTDQLELDHIDRTQKVSHKIWSWSKTKMKAEIAKCQVLCVECHRKKSAAEQGNDYPAHGANRYLSHGCRCSLCREGARQRIARQRERRKQAKALDSDKLAS